MILNKKFGQVSVEFILVVAFFLLILVPILIVVNSTMSLQQSKAEESKIYQEFSKLAASIDIVGSTGPKSTIYVNLYFPSKVKIGTSNKELYLIYNSLDGRKITFLHFSNSNLAFFDETPLLSPKEVELNEGKYNIIVEASNYENVVLKID